MHAVLQTKASEHDPTATSSKSRSSSPSEELRQEIAVDGKPGNTNAHAPGGLKPSDVQPARCAGSGKPTGSCTDEKSGERSLQEPPRSNDDVGPTEHADYLPGPEGLRCRSLKALLEGSHWSSTLRRRRSAATEVAQEGETELGMRREGLLSEAVKTVEGVLSEGGAKDSRGLHRVDEPCDETVNMWTSLVDVLEVREASGCFMVLVTRVNRSGSP